jgi:hypothetical protein
MAGRISTSIMVTVVATFLAACTKEPPKCSDDETIALIRQIIMDQTGGSEGLIEKDIKENLVFEFPRASAFDEKIKKYNCEAKLIAGGMYQLPITYESQLDDKNRHIVVIEGISRGDLLGVRSGMIEGIKKTEARRRSRWIEGVKKVQAERGGQPRP